MAINSVVPLRVCVLCTKNEKQELDVHVCTVHCNCTISLVNNSTVDPISAIFGYEYKWTTHVKKYDNAEVDFIKLVSY